MYQSKIK